ncbi:MAG: fibronectin type III domain-containing protein [Thermoplasmata archaeon]|nr:fibronectin type III domain-containing protein [Thermoplasmata archaeon]MCI4358820.1 fibronectin type III domain-containing protein [Thermoplasmata archaeon]
MPWSVPLMLLTIVMMATPTIPMHAQNENATAPWLAPSWSVFGNITTPGGSGIAGANVTVVQYPCPSYPSTQSGIASCHFVGSALSKSGGAFSVGLPASSASYYLFTNRTTGYGGADWYFVASGPSSNLGDVVAQPFLPYGNATLTLPDYYDLSPYRTAVDQNVQVPLLSWTADGAFYVNRSLELVFFNFATQQVTPIGPWLPLYDNICYYGCQKDTEWVTSDGSFVYELGCRSICGSASTLTFYAVNVSTGQTFEWNWSGVSSASTNLNGQVNMVGLNGSYTEAVLTTSQGQMWAWDLRNHTQWRLGVLSFFEANNLYWVPPLNSWFNIAANGATTWTVVQYMLTRGGITSVASSTWGPGGAPSNYVAGMDYDLTGHRLYWTAGYCAGSAVYTGYATLGIGGVMSGAGYLPSGHRCGFGEPLAEGSQGGLPTGSSEHRIGLAAQGPWVAGTWNNTFENDSWLLDPGSGQWYATNVSLVWGTQYSGGGEYPAQQAYNEEGLFFNGTYTLSLEAMDCHTFSSCLIDQTASRGKVYYYWRLGEPKFPFPSDSPIAQPLPPATPVETGIGTGATYLNLSWAQPAAGEFPLLNYTVYWGTSPNFTASMSLLPTARFVNLTGLSSAQTYYMEVVPLNQHFFGTPLKLSDVTAPRSSNPPGGPTGLSELGSGPTSATLAWVVHNGSFAYRAVYLFYREGPCASASAVSGPWAYVDVEAPDVRVATATGLYDGGTYCFSVAGWNGSADSEYSNGLTVELNAPFDLRSPSRTGNSVALAWTAPAAIDNGTVLYGGVCGVWSAGVGVGRSTFYNVTGLNRGESYCFEVQGWWRNASSGYSNSLRLATNDSLAAGAITVLHNGTLGPPSADVNQSITFVEVPSGGDGNYSGFVWQGLSSTECSGLDTDRATCVFGYPEALTVRALVHDGNGDVVESVPLDFMVHLLPQVRMPSANPSSADVGQTVRFAEAAVSWSSLEYTWGGLSLASCSGLTTSSPTCELVQPGPLAAFVLVTDQDGVSRVSPTVRLLVSPALNLTNAEASRNVADIHQVVGFFASASGGVGPYGFIWSGLPAGCESAGTSKVSCEMESVGAMEISVQAVDSNGERSATNASIRVTTDSDPQVSARSVSAPSVSVGGFFSVSARASGGSGWYEYVWTGLPSDCPSSGPTVVCEVETAGSYHVVVTVRDSNGFNATSSPVELVGRSGSQGFFGPSGLPVELAIGAAVGLAVLGILVWRLRKGVR